MLTGLANYGVVMHQIDFQVLLNDDEDLSNFRSQSVKKKGSNENKIVST